MSRIYKNLNREFTVVSNHILKYNLSLKAIGLYLYIIQKPDGWNFSVAGVQAQTKDGKTSIKTAIHELERAGFLVRTQGRNDGRYSGADWLITDDPKKANLTKSKSKMAENPMAENQPTENPTTENTTQVNTKVIKTKKVNTKNIYRYSDFSSLLEIEAEDMEHLTNTYGCNESFVRSCIDDIGLWLERMGKPGTHGKPWKNYLAGLSGWVKRESLKIIKDSHGRHLTFINPE